VTSPALLARWVALGESETQEFRRSTANLERGTETICGMLNRQGGRVLYGVRPNGDIEGQQTSDRTLEKITGELGETEPPIFPEVERLMLDSGQEVLSVSVSRGTQRPYAYKGRAFLRVGNSTKEMSREEYNALLFERLHAVQRWENEVAAGWTVEQLDRTEITRTLEEAIRRGRVEEPGTRDTFEVLRGLSLTKGDQLLRAAVVLFGKDELMPVEYPQCFLRLARFRGTDRNEFLDNKQVHGHAFELMRRAERFLIDNLPIAGRVVPGLFERQDDPLYPLEALREALANAFCHRDYSLGGGSVAVGIYDDRLEITSTGGLHFGLTPDDLWGPHESQPWNPLVAGAFYRRGIIEQWGRGTLKIAALTEKAGLPRPDINAVAGAVTVRFLPSRYVAPQRTQLDLSAEQQTILQTLGNSPRPLSLHEFKPYLPDLSEWRLKQDLQMLKKSGLIDTSGRARTARWFLTPAVKEEQK
jgi:ATP-dependent DNA helicase RecG